MAQQLSSIVVKASLKALMSLDIDGGNTDAASSSIGKDLVPETTLANGTSANQADRIWGDTSRTLTSGNSESINVYSFTGIDLGAGSGKDSLGQTPAAVEIVSILVRNRASSAGSLVIGGEGTANAITSFFGANTHTLTLKPGGWFQIFAPTDPAYAVGSANNNLLKFAASGGNVTYDLIVLYRSA